MAQPHDQFRHMLEYDPANNSSAAASSSPIAADRSATQPVDDIVPSNFPSSPALNTLMDDCSGAIYAPTNTVCCDVSSGLWKPVPVPVPVPADVSATVTGYPLCPTST